MLTILHSALSDQASDLWQQLAPCCSGQYHCTTSFKNVRTQILPRFKPWLWPVGDLQLREPLTMVPAGNKAQTSFIGQPFHKNNSSSFIIISF